MEARGLFDDATMSFGDHLEDLRKRLLLAVAPALPLAIVLFLLSDTFIRVLVLPLRSALAENGLPPTIQVLGPPELLLLKLKLGFILAAVLTGPWILWQAWLFIRPGLYSQERRFVYLLIPGSAILTAAAIALLYFIMLPLVLVMMIRVGTGLDLGTTDPSVDARLAPVLATLRDVPLRYAEPAEPLPGDAWFDVNQMELLVAVASEGDDGGVEVLVAPRRQPASVMQAFRLSTYINFVLLLLLGLVIAFQMPLVILLLGWVGIASPGWLRIHRRHALLVCGVLSAVLTPQDPMSMVIMLIPLYGLYELGIVLLVIAPASAVAEGTLLRGGTGNQSPDKEVTQPVKPVQAESTVPRTPGASDAGGQPEGDATDEGGGMS